MDELFDDEMNYKQDIYKADNCIFNAVQFITENPKIECACETEQLMCIFQKKIRCGVINQGRTLFSHISETTENLLITKSFSLYVMETEIKTTKKCKRWQFYQIKK